MEKQPIRVIKGSMQPYEPFWKITDAANSQSGQVELEFFGSISEYSWWGDEITPKKFRDDLYSKGKGNPIRMLVNSTGGEVYAADVIRAIIQGYPGEVTADIVGIAASAATIVVTAANRVIMRESALFMIHNPSMIALGDATEMRKVAEILDKVKAGILSTYVTKTKMEPEKLSELMDKETWMTAKEAVEMGFADEVIDGFEEKNLLTNIPANYRAGFTNCLNSYLHIPEDLTISIKDEGEKPEEPNEANVQPGGTSSSDDPPADANEHEAQRLRDYLDIFA